MYDLQKWISCWLRLLEFVPCPPAVFTCSMANAHTWEAEVSHTLKIYTKCHWLEGGNINQPGGDILVAMSSFLSHHALLSTAFPYNWGVPYLILAWFCDVCHMPTPSNCLTSPTSVTPKDTTEHEQLVKEWHNVHRSPSRRISPMAKGRPRIGDLKGEVCSNVAFTWLIMVVLCCGYLWINKKHSCWLRDPTQSNKLQWSSDLWLFHGCNLNIFFSSSWQADFGSSGCCPFTICAELCRWTEKKAYTVQQ